MRTFLAKPLVIAIITLLSLILCVSFLRHLQHVSGAKKTLSSLEEQVHADQQQVALMEQQLTQAQQALSQEKVIRDQLLLQKPGERVIQIPDLAPLETSEQMSATPSAWQEWRAFFAKNMVK